ncbi:Uncharacterized protein APZ42_003163 [Daphnia magna]|uniref:Uncharacterized protein n=1 Tax=Daphnia magna TaxID=35525 RepID=A0A164HS47_9CRUS|nr:Uncharacterized protein APZ42_003163 [Daphnia magna]
MNNNNPKINWEKDIKGQSHTLTHNQLFDGEVGVNRWKVHNAAKLI